MKKTIAVIVSAVMATTMALAATGCGSSSSEESKAAPTIPKATNATTAPVQTSTAPRNSASYGEHHEGVERRQRGSDRGGLRVLQRQRGGWRHD